MRAARAGEAADFQDWIDPHSDHETPAINFPDYGGEEPYHDYWGQFHHYHVMKPPGKGIVAASLISSGGAL